MNAFDKDVHEIECIDRRSGKDRRVKNDISSFCSDRRCCADRRNGTPRRSCDRFRVDNFTFVKLHGECEEDLGQLLDISPKGLSFRYLSEVKQPKVFNELSIIWPGNFFAVAGIPFRTISDALMDHSIASAAIIFRRAGVQFVSLTPSQEFELGHFIKMQILGRA